VKRFMIFGLLVLFLSALSAAAQEVPAPRPGGGLFFDVLPVTKSGRLLVPLRPLFEWVGARVEYDSGKITAYGAGSSIPLVELTIGRTRARLSGQPYQLDVAPEIINRRTFVPLRFVAESFGVWVDAEGHIVNLRVPQYELEAQMAIPPDPGSHEYKIWQVVGRWYNLPGTQAKPEAELPHWNLYSEERQVELTAEVGPTAPTLIEAHWGGREVKGIRILSSAADPEAGAAAVRIVVKYADSGVNREDFSLVLQPNGWKVRRHSGLQVTS